MITATAAIGTEDFLNFAFQLKFNRYRIGKNVWI